MTQRIALDDLSLNVAIDGKGEDWIVLSNSLGATLDMWAPQLELLTSRFRVLRYDTRGHGLSDAPRGPYGFADLTADAIGLMDYFEIDRAAFMGLSMGGMTGLGLALAHPDRFSRIICADGRADAPPPFRAMWDERIARVEAGGLDAIVDGTLASWFTERWRAENPDLLDRVRAMILSNDPAGYIACCRALRGLDYLGRLHELTVPALFVGGEQDGGAAPDVMTAMADATPGGRYVPVTDAAHVANINNPAGFNRAIAAFLGLG